MIFLSNRSAHHGDDDSRKEAYTTISPRVGTRTCSVPAAPFLSRLPFFLAFDDVMITVSFDWLYFPSLGEILIRRGQINTANTEVGAPEI